MKTIKKVIKIKDAQKLVKHFARNNEKAAPNDDRWKDYPNVDKFDHLHEELIEMSRLLRYKTREEREQIIKDKKSVFNDGIGDLFFALCRLANQLDIDIEDAFNNVSSEIIIRFNPKENNKTKHTTSHKNK